MLVQQFSAAAQHPTLLDIHKGTNSCLDIQVWMVPKELLFDISGSKIQTRAYTLHFNLCSEVFNLCLEVFNSGGMHSYTRTWGLH